MDNTFQSIVKKARDPSIFIIFGASGDLTKRLLMPALYNLCYHDALPEKFFILGTAMEPFDDNTFREKIAKDLQKYATRPFEENVYQKHASAMYYIPAQFDDPKTYEKIKAKIQELDTQNSMKANLIFYLAVSPSIFEMIASHLGQAGLSNMEGRTCKLILEKPFGRDYKSAIALDIALHQHFKEKQIWRIDHYLGKETVQNILAFRFGNGIFEPLWNRNYIDHVQITVSEEVGVETRASYYDKAGALRDMVQNHILQVISYVAMEPPNSFEAETIRSAKVAALQAVNPMSHPEVLLNAVRGQYGAGEMGGNSLLGYRQEAGVDPNSTTETFVALRLEIDNWRWNGVPFYVRTGKRLKQRYAEVVINFKRAPKSLFKLISSDEVISNELRFFLQPKQGIELVLKAKVPGRGMMLKPVKMDFDYEESFHTERGTGYEVLLFDCLIDDPTLFSRSDLVERSWAITQPIIDVWSSLPPLNFPNYESGSWGPAEAFDLIEREGRTWRTL